MRVKALLLIPVIVPIAAHAQSVNVDFYKNSEMVQRWDSATKKAIAATQPDVPGQRKKKKSDPLLTNAFQEKTFTGQGGNFDKKLSGQKDFLYDQKASAGKFVTRSFFGLKNPWFGKKVVETDQASLWTKSGGANADKKFPLESAETREFYQADKNAGRNETVPTRSIEVRGKSQGVVDAVSNNKNLTVEQVRELLNKQ